MSHLVFMNSNLSDKYLNGASFALTPSELRANKKYELLQAASLQSEIQVHLYSHALKFLEYCPWMKLVCML